MHIIYSLQKMLTPCPVCFSFISNPSGLCHFCDGELQKMAFCEPQVIRGILNFSLWEWDKDQDEIISPILVHLKNRPQNFYAHYVDLLVENHSSILRDKILIPAPRYKETPDHAFYLCQMLSQKMGLPMLDPLRKASPATLKRLPRKQRNKRRVLSHGFSLKNFHKNQQFLLIDDLVTTGATALNSLQALSSGREQQLNGRLFLMTLFRRPLVKYLS